MYPQGKNPIGGVDDIMGLLSTTGGHLSRLDAEEIVKIADTDGDGVIDIHEFVNLVTDSTQADFSWRLRSGFRAILIIGGPGSGKGILCDRLVKHANIDHVSSGDLLRNEVASGSALGKQCQETMSFRPRSYQLRDSG